MPLDLLIASAAAITLLSLLASKLFPVQRKLDADRVHRNFLRSYPDEAIVGLILSRDRLQAVVRLTHSNALGLVKVLGDRVVTRLIEVQDGTRIEFTGDQMAIDMPDLTFHRSVLTLLSADQEDAAQWSEPWLCNGSTQPLRQGN